ncbi:peptidyl-tRNA hydrolase, partial [Pilobolus umbonatus]
LVGLGNITYPNTRHNVGMMVLEHIAHSYHLNWSTNKQWNSETTQLSIESVIDNKGYEITLLKPKKAMNISGSCVMKAVKDLSIPLNNLYVFHDDMQRDLGKLSLKKTGSANGHNGVKSVIDHVRNQQFNRVRIGIGRPIMDDRSHHIVSDYVLGKFTREE